MSSACFPRALDDVADDFESPPRCEGRLVAMLSPPSACLATHESYRKTVFLFTLVAGFPRRFVAYSNW